LSTTEEQLQPQPVEESDEAMASEAGSLTRIWVKSGMNYDVRGRFPTVLRHINDAKAAGKALVHFPVDTGHRAAVNPDAVQSVEELARS
jgi:hypothetical protein